MSFLPPQYYFHIYIWLIALLSFYEFSKYSSYSQQRLGSNKEESSVGVIVLTLFLVFFIGTRPISGQYFVDMKGYFDSWTIFADPNYQITWDTDNKIFDNLFYSLAGAGVNIYVFYVLIAAIYFIGIAWACSHFFPRDKMAAFLVYLAALSTFSYGTNGIKAGAAASIFLVALVMRERGNMALSIILLLISWGFHHSMVLPVAAFVASLFVKNPKWYFAFWIFCFLIALFHISFFQELFAGFANEKSAEYLVGGGENIRLDILNGFRIDFIIYSAAPIYIGWKALQNKKQLSSNYTFLLNLYMSVNGVWLLCMYSEYTNRISYLSWFMLPIILVYPFLNEQWGRTQYNTFRIVALGSLFFTLFLEYIYY